MGLLTPRLFGGALTTALAPVAALPTTAAQFVLWNGEPPNGKTYLIQSVGFTGIASAAAALVTQLLIHICPGNQALLSGTAAKGPFAVDGVVNPNYKSNAMVLGAVTLTAGQAASGFWHPVGPSVNGAAATATISMGSWAAVNGIYTLAPGAILSLATFCSAAGSATNLISCTWAEVQL